MAPDKLDADNKEVLGVQARNYFLSFLPPHIRRRGLSAPPLKSVLLRYVRCISLPYFPWAAMDWRKYPKLLPSDILAGITVGIMLVPQGLAYSVLATLPAIYGLYTATIAGYVYSIFGTSGQLTIGPVALVSFFMSETFAKMGVSIAVSDKDPTKNKAAKYATHVRAQLAPVISLAVGLMLCAMAFFRIGSLMKFISPSVLTGFVTGSGIQIFISQSKYMWGVKVPRANKNYKEWLSMFQLVSEGKGNRWDQVIGFSSFAVLFVFYFLRKAVQPKLRKMKDTRPILSYVLMLLMSGVTLAVIIVSTLFAWYEIRVKGNKVAIVGKVPAGFNKFEVPAIFNDFYGEGLAFSQVLLQSIPLTFLTYMESVSVGRKYALVHRYALDMTQELWALGFGCVAASFFQAYPLGGSFSRTALKADMGVKTPFANVFTSVFVTLVLVCATNLLTFVPMSVLGAVICTAVFSLLDFGEMWRALWVAPIDFLVMVFTCVYTAVINVEWGLIYGIMVSVVVLMLQISKLDMDSIGQLRLETAGRKPQFRPKNQSYPHVLEHEKIKVLRLTANLFFGNVSVFRDEFYASLATSESPVRAVIVDAQGVPEIDLSALAVIDEMVSEVNKQGVRLYFAGCHGRVKNALDSFDLLDEVGGSKLASLSLEDVFVSVAEELDLEDAIPAGLRSRSTSLCKAPGAGTVDQQTYTVSSVEDEERLKRGEFKDPLDRV